MKNKKDKITVFLRFSAYCLLLTAYFFLSSCGYRMIGSKFLPFDSIIIKPVQNKTYEPRLEEKLHNALSNEFVNQGIEVKVADASVELESTITVFELGAIGAIDEIIKEQELIMLVDMKVINDKEVTEFKAMKSPIKITFQTTGTVSESVAHKESAIDKACAEIAKEMVSKIIIKYAK